MTRDRHKFAVSFRPSAEVRKRLRLGNIVRAVVLQRVSGDTALISVRGLNAVAVSPLPLQRGQVLHAQVADIGDKVHLRIVPPRQLREVSRTTTAAELARHLASLGIEPTDAALRLAAAMLLAELPITAENVSKVSSVVSQAGRDDEATAAAAAYGVRHRLSTEPRTTAEVRAALFEPPCLGELLFALSAALSADKPATAGSDPLNGALESLLRQLRLGGPAEWLDCAVELCVRPRSSADSGTSEWLVLLGGRASADAGELGGIVAHLRTVLAGLRVVNDVSANQPARSSWVLQVPFMHGRALATAFVELSGPAGLPLPFLAPVDREVRAWVPLAGDGEAVCELKIRRGTARGTLRLTGADEPRTFAAVAEEWVGSELGRVGVKLSSLAFAPDENDDPELLPTVGLDFQI